MNILLVVIFAILFLKEWGPSCPHEFLGAYKLEADMSWTKAEDVAKRSKDIEMVDQLLSSQVPAIQYVTGLSGNGVKKAISRPEKSVIEDITDEDHLVEEPFHY